jgi:hypothetical protein
MDMKTVTVQIGNSDDRLTQKEWSQFVQWIDMEMRARSDIHFFGTSVSDEEWQNACWVGVIEFERDLIILKYVLTRVKRLFHQESVAWTVGDTEFI